MRLGTSVSIALDALRTHLLRTVLTMLGIIIGVAAVIAMVAVGAGAEARIAAQIRSIGSNLIVVMSGASTSGGIRWGLGTQMTLSEDDARAIASEVRGVDAAAPTIRGAAQIVYGNANWSTGIQGTTPDYVVAREWEVAAGKLFTTADVDASAKVAVLGDTVARTLFGDADAVGQTIRIKNVPFTVIGVLAPKGQSAWGQDQDDLVLVPISTARKRVLGVTAGSPRAVRVISVRVSETHLVGEVEDQLRALLRQRHRLGPGQEDDFSIRVLAEVFAAQEESARVMTLLLAAIASVSLLVGGIGIMNIMLVSVTERTREIGLRMAVGARRIDVLSQFLVEATTLAVLGGLIGIAVGLGASRAIAGLAGWTTQVPVEAIAVAFLFAGLVGVFFGFYPARKASRLDPITALRHE